MIELSLLESFLIALNIGFFGTIITLIFLSLKGLSLREASRKTFFNGVWLFGLSFGLLVLQSRLDF